MAFRMANRRGMMYWLIFLLPVAAATGGVSLEGKHLRVTTSRLYTVMDYVYDSNGNLTGYNGNGYALLSWLSEALKFSYEFSHIYPDITNGENHNGTWDGMVGDLQRGDSDLALGVFTMQLDYYMAMEFTANWDISEYTLFFPYPPKESIPWAAVKPFKPTVWLCIFVFFLFIAYFTYKIAKLSPYMSPETEELTFKTTFSYQLELILGQGSCGDFVKGKVMTAVVLPWLLATAVLMMVYNGLLVSFLCTQVAKPLVTSLDDLVDKPELQFATQMYSGIDEDWMAVQEGKLKRMGDFFRDHPELRTGSLETCMDMAANKTAVCVMVFDSGSTYVNADYEKYQTCRITRTVDTFSQKQTVWGLPKGSLYKPLFDKKILTAKDMGLTGYWVRENYNITKKCRDYDSVDQGAKRLTLINLESGFLFLAIGIGVSTFAFIMELVGFHAYKRVTVQLVKKTEN